METDKTLPVAMVACDLDGTLLGPGDEGLDEALEVAKLCRERGLHFTIATGRVFGAVVKYVRLLGISGPVITNGGALVAALGEEPIYERTIEPDLAKGVFRDLRARGLPFYVVAGKDMLTEWEGDETAAYAENISYDIKLVPSLEEMEIAPTQIVVRTDADKAAALLEDFRVRWSLDLTVIRSLPHLIEFQAKGVSKAKALEFLAQYYGLDAERVLAVGDGLNDVDMLEWAGVSACVGNACDEVREVAGYISKAPYAKGVLEAIKNSLLG
ncbi:MAG TPA: HAD family hydrolase [Firmicutes bacterium]|nr:HAD family hydrolase [Candidatus Fermentithermobacillaceae bacterium]